MPNDELSANDNQPLQPIEHDQATSEEKRYTSDSGFDFG
jgi:hypothetical protein